MDDARYYLHGPILSRLHHDGRDRREGGSRSLPASVRAVAGGAWMVPVRPRRHPRDPGAQCDRTAGALASFEGQGLASLAPLPLLSLFVYVLFHRPLGEEPGWRGFALPRLQSLHGPLVGSLILGVLWGLWNLPLFFTPWNTLTTLNVVGFVLATTCLAIMYTWVFNNTKGSLLIAILLHWSFDLSTLPVASLFPAPIIDEYGLLVILPGFGALALVLVASTRGRLGYQHYRQTVEHDPAATSPT